ncbi:SDR family oxidoreductase [Arcicella sp. LKC2W]|uniref:NAD-dependent epimerase/dehydratase family protein n=1 Tax=Arcicella sp. LKC2W TaxID=2984198 RepID=UPI002B2007A3|nr:SDR family oxidoreductase [Arcicella sp. LKC2W]MEA5461277.1 SDR family oxidoreductase [Arcicella sp. LKC2W]
MNVLIIGSKGFIGSHVLKTFVQESSFFVFGCDVIQDYDTPNYQVIDATNADFSEVFQQYKFDICINCSGAASVPDSILHPLRDFQLNTVNVYKLLEAIHRFCPTCRYINISSAAVYGNPNSLPIVESQYLAPLSPYGKHKLYAEQICEQFTEFYGIDTCSLRVFSAYGVGLKKQLFWDLFNKSRNTEQIELWGSGNESRDFIEVGDIVEIIKLLIIPPKFAFPILNVGNGREWKIKDVTELFFEVLGRNITVDFKGEQRAGDPQNWQADVSRLKTIGYVSKINIIKGLINYCTWLKQIEKGSDF